MDDLKPTGRTRWLTVGTVGVGVVCAAVVGLVAILRANNSRSSLDERTVAAATKPTPGNTPADPRRAELKARLTKEEYHVTQEKGTERAFTGKYWNTHATGLYKCVCCGSTLFDSKAKYDSGTGWPSFTEPIDETRVDTTLDGGLLTQRKEVVCKNCRAHLGHVFDDGPQPTGLRYCINSAALSFDETEPEEGE